MSASDDIHTAAENNLRQLYESGNQCDDWTKKVLDEAGVESDSYYAGPTGTTTVAQHIEAAESSGIAIEEAEETGWYLVFMDESPARLNYTPHAGLLEVNEDGVYFYDSSYSNEDHLSYKDVFASVDAFEGAYGYDAFHYIPITP